MTNIVLQLLGMAGIGALVYPDAADWFATLNHNAQVSGYVESVEQTPSEERQKILAAAYAYNETLSFGDLMDPYVEQNPDEAYRDEVYQAYEEMLRVSGTDVIGTVNYPSLGIGLPVYHGTSDAVIRKGVGHLYGTSLPVGGPGTHSVLTAHSGLPNAKLFTSLSKAKVGDTFWISVLGEDHFYEVRATEVILPGDTDRMRIIEGEDWVTLFTCTPIGINSHRFMVYAQRVETPETTDSQVVAGDGISVGFPWWAVWLVLGSAVLAWFLFAPRRKRRASEPVPAEPGPESALGGSEPVPAEPGPESVPGESEPESAFGESERGEPGPGASEQAESGPRESG